MITSLSYDRMMQLLDLTGKKLEDLLSHLKITKGTISYWKKKGNVPAFYMETMVGFFNLDDNGNPSTKVPDKNTKPVTYLKHLMKLHSFKAGFVMWICNKVPSDSRLSEALKKGRGLSPRSIVSLETNLFSLSEAALCGKLREYGEHMKAKRADAIARAMKTRYGKPAQSVAIQPRQETSNEGGLLGSGKVGEMSTVDVYTALSRPALLNAARVAISTKHSIDIKAVDEILTASATLMDDLRMAGGELRLLIEEQNERRGTPR